MTQRYIVADIDNIDNKSRSHKSPPGDASQASCMTLRPLKGNHRSPRKTRSFNASAFVGDELLHQRQKATDRRLTPFRLLQCR